MNSIHIIMARGKRYSKEKRQEIIRFARAFDKKNGRGGKAAAAKKFGVNVNSVTNWMAGAKKEKAVNSTAAVSAPNTSTAKADSSAIAMLERLLEIQKQIDELNSEYSTIKSKL